MAVGKRRSRRKFNRLGHAIWSSHVHGIDEWPNWPSGTNLATRDFTGRAQATEGAPLSDQNEGIRVRRLKEQARRLSAYERWNPDNSRFEMRLLVQPAHGNRDDKRQIINGAVFRD